MRPLLVLAMALFILAMALFIVGAVMLVLGPTGSAPIWFGAVAAGSALLVIDRVQAGRAGH